MPLTHIDSDHPFRVLRVDLVISSHEGVDVDITPPSDGSFKDIDVDLFDYDLKQGEVVHNVWYNAINNLGMVALFKDLNVTVKDAGTVRFRVSVDEGAYARVKVALYALVYREG